MRRIGLLVGLVCITGSLVAQETKHFRIENSNGYRSVTLNYSTSSGVCYLAQGDSNNPLEVLSARDIEEFNHSFNKNASNGNLVIDIALDEKNGQGFSQSISNKVFTKTKPEENIWKVLLAEDIAYDLNLSYGIGEAFIDLAGLNVEKLKVKTGSANVNIGYLHSMPNLTQMDTMAIKVDLGNVNVRQIYLANVQNIAAEVGFGNMLLDLSESMDEPCNINASVGAGSLEILIPKGGEVPILVRVKESMLCDVKLTKSFIEKGDNVFVNMDIDEDSDIFLEFNVDVSFGSITFREKK